MTVKMYFTREFKFYTFQQNQRRVTANYEVHVPGETDYYVVLKEIVEVEYDGLLNLKCIIFNCGWCYPTTGVGVRFNNFGVVDVNGSRRYTKFEPYVLVSQAMQVTFIPYLRTRSRRDQK